MIVWYLLGAAGSLILGYILFLVLCALLVDPKKEYETHSGFYRWHLNFATAIALKLCRVRLHVTGLDTLPSGKRVLFVSNHRSNFDPIVTWHVLKKWQPAFVSKQSNFRIPLFGRLIRKCCFMAIDRENPRNAILTIQKAARLLDRGQVSVAIYPEGTRSKEQVLLPFHNGIFKVAQKGMADIAVLSVQGTEQIQKNFPWHHTDVYLDVLEVIPAQQAASTRTDAIGSQVRQTLLNKLGK